MTSSRIAVWRESRSFWLRCVPRLQLGDKNETHSFNDSLDMLTVDNTVLIDKSLKFLQQLATDIRAARRDYDLGLGATTR